MGGELSTPKKKLNQMGSRVDMERSSESAVTDLTQTGPTSYQVRSVMSLSNVPQIKTSATSVKSGTNIGGGHKKRSQKKFIRLVNLLTNQHQVDLLHLKAKTINPCSLEVCAGSLVKASAHITRKKGEVKAKALVLEEAKDFLEQYFASIKRQDSVAHQNRWLEVLDEVEDTGTYNLTEVELVFGCKTAWRNAPMCIGRIQWNKLQVFDARHIYTARGMFEAICGHIKYATNGGRIRSALTVFPPRSDGTSDFRIWNPFLISYAGYKQQDGSVVGFPPNVKLTEIAQKLGWCGSGGQFDVLPLILQANGNDPEFFCLPPEIVLEVELSHPVFPWFKPLGLKFPALLPIAEMCLTIGGVEFPSSPFNGWELSSKVCRLLCDETCYNITKTIAEAMQLDVSNPRTCWKDIAYTEVSRAILHSYQKANVVIVDHHTASDSFMRFFDKEHSERGGCPSNKYILVPPLTGSSIPIYYQEMLNYQLNPSFEHQEPAWVTHQWKRDSRRGSLPRDPGARRASKIVKHFHFSQLGQAVRFTALLMHRALAKRIKVMILFASETGRSENFARTLGNIFKYAFDVTVACMDEFDPIELQHEALLLIVTSTFGNGEAPENGRDFITQMQKSAFETKPQPDLGASRKPRHSYYGQLKMSEAAVAQQKNLSGSIYEMNEMKETNELFVNVRFAVFGLGSSAYPSFVEFGRYIDRLIAVMGGQRITDLGIGDELSGQEESFRSWANQVFKDACSTFCVGEEHVLKEVSRLLVRSDSSWTKDNYRVRVTDQPAAGLVTGLHKLSNKNIMKCQFLESTNLQSPASGRETLYIRLACDYDVDYEPGDHIGVYPENDPEQVGTILSRLADDIDPDKQLQMDVLEETTTPFGFSSHWVVGKRLEVCSLRQALTRYLDINNSPSAGFLHYLAQFATDEEDISQLKELSKSTEKYVEWKTSRCPSISDTLDQFQSVRLPSSFLLSQVPVLQPRFYSISSTLSHSPGEIQMTVVMLQYRQAALNRIRYGVCCGYYRNLKPGSTVYSFIRSAIKFHMPDDKMLPVVMVGPGSGIAPLRSFWLQRYIDIDPENKNRRSIRRFGRMTLYFGCRNIDYDSLYAAERERMVSLQVLDREYVAQSRSETSRKTYVQHLLVENGEEVYRDVIEQRGHVFVCGDVQMADGVLQAVVKVVQEHANLTEEEAQEVVEKLKDENRYHEDIFGISQSNTKAIA